MTTTTAGHVRSAVVVVLALGVLAGGALEAPPALAHGEGLTPYLYVTAPPGVTSAGTPEQGVSTQPLDGFGFAGTTDNQMQLSLPEGALPLREGEQGIRVQLDQLDPARLPALPAGLEPEGNGYRVSLAYSPSGASLDRLSGPASLALSAPAAPTGVYELVDGGWVTIAFTPVAVETGFSSVISLHRPGTFLQAYDRKKSPASPQVKDAAPSIDRVAESARARDRPLPLLTVPAGLAAVVLLLLFLRQRRRSTGASSTP